MAVQDLHTLDVSSAIDKIFSTGSVIPGAIMSLVPETPTINVGKNVPLVMGGRAKGALVHEGGQKPDNGRNIQPLPFVTAKLVYSQRISEEFMRYEEAQQGDIVSRYVSDWLSRSMPRDMDTIIAHGLDPFTSKRDDQLANYLTKKGSSIAVQAEGYTPEDLDAAFAQAAGELGKRGEIINGIALSPDAAMKLSTLTSNGTQKYPGTGIFGLMGNTLGGRLAASTPEIGAADDTALIMGDWTQLLLGFAGNATWKAIEYGNPDCGQYDLQEVNQICIRLELMFGFQILNPNAFAVVSSKPRLAVSSREVHFDSKSGTKKINVTRDGEPTFGTYTTTVDDDNQGWLAALPESAGTLGVIVRSNKGKTARVGSLTLTDKETNQRVNVFVKQDAAASD